MKTIERLRKLKAAAIERMKAINDLAAKESRDLNEAETLEYEAKKADVAAHDADIESLTAAPTPIDEAKLRREGATAEQLRQDGLRAQFAAASRHCKALPEALLTEAISKNHNADQFGAALLAAMATAEEAKPDTRSQAETGISRDQRDTLRMQLEAAIEVRGNPSAPKEIAEKGRDYAGLTLLDMARECLTASGVKVRGMSRNEIARVALQGRFGAAEYFGGMISTSDFPNILANVANKTLRQAYEAAPRTFTSFCRMVTATDFKPINRVQLSDVPTLPKLNEHGEFHRTALSDSKETYSLATFGEVIAITRKVIINDDLQALTRVPAGLGVAAANLESDTVWAVITANAALSDSVALFHATHKNLNTSNALAQAGLAAARTAMRKQTGPKGTILNLVPKYLLLPAALENIGLQLLFPIQLAASAVTNVVPQWIQNLTPVIEPRLDAVASVGATNWYLAADPSNIDTIEYCYLEGQQGVYIETRQGFDVDGTEIKARLDFAAAAIEFRGMSKNVA